MPPSHARKSPTLFLCGVQVQALPGKQVYWRGVNLLLQVSTTVAEGNGCVLVLHYCSSMSLNW